MLLIDAKRLWFYIKMGAVISMIKEEAMCTMDKKGKGVFSWLKIRRKRTNNIQSVQHTGKKPVFFNLIENSIDNNALLFEERRPVSQDSINFYAQNSRLYTHLVTNSKYNPVLKEFDDLDYSSGNEIHSIVLIKNLAENAQSSDPVPIKPIQMRRKDFSYIFPAINIVMPVLGSKKTLNILLFHHALGRKIKKLQKAVTCCVEDLDTDRLFISNLVIFVESVIYRLVETLQKKDSEFLQFDKIKYDLYHMSKNYYRKKIDAKTPNMDTFRIEYLLYGWDAFKELEKLADSVYKKQKEQESVYSSDEKMKEIRVGIWMTVYALKSDMKQCIFENEIVPSIKYFYSKYLGSVLSYKIDIVPSSGYDKESILRFIINEITNIASNEADKLRSISSGAIYNSKKTIPEVVNPLKHKVFSYLNETLEAYKKKGIIIYIEDALDKIIMKFIEIFFYLEGERSLVDNQVYLNACIQNAKDNLKAMDFTKSLESLRKFLNGFFSRLASNIEKVTVVNKDKKVKINKEALSIDIFNSIYADYNTYLKGFHSTVTREKEKDEVWDNPAFLHYTISGDLDPAKTVLYVIYKNEADKKLYKKQVKDTNHNLRQFSEAKTHEDIEDMDGEEEEEINMEELLKLEIDEVEYVVISKDLN